MNIKTVLPLALALVLGLIAAIVAKNAISKSKNPAESMKQTQIVVAKRNVSPGKQLTAEDVGLSPIATPTPPPGAFTSMDQIDKRVTSLPMVQGQPVLEAVLAPIGTGSGLPALIAPGMRAITIETNEFSGVAGMIQPGSRVDVVSTLHNTRGEGSIAKTIVQNLTVLAIGQRTDSQQAQPGDAPPSRAVTLQVTPKDGEMIELAASLGRPRLVLRTNKDSRPVQSEGVTLTQLVGGTGSDTSVGDPFQPGTATVASSGTETAPTTRPTMTVAEAFVAAETVTRQVSIIRGGVETTVSFRVPARSLVNTVTDTTAEKNTEPSGNTSSSIQENGNGND